MATIALRPYQQEARTKIDQGYALGTRRMLSVLPTGSGKTILFGSLLAERPGRGLVLAHRQELLDQAAEKIAILAPERTVGVVQGDRDDRDADIVIASVPSLAARGARRLKQFHGDEFSTIVIDEAHHAVAPSYRKVLDHFGALAPETDVLTVGVTATTERADGIGLGNVFERIVIDRDLAWAIEEGYCVDVLGQRVMIDVDLNTVGTTNGDFDLAQLAQAFSQGNAPEAVADAYLQYAADRTAIIFCASIALSERTAEVLRERGVLAMHLDGETPDAWRRSILAGVTSGQVRVVCNCSVLTEGYDEPRVDCVIIARPTLSQILYTQMVGRGVRLALNKTNCLVIDIVGVTERSDLIGLADLTGGAVIDGSVREANERDLAAALAWDGTGKLSDREVDLLDRHWRRTVRPPVLTWRREVLEFLNVDARMQLPVNRKSAMQQQGWVHHTPSYDLNVVQLKSGLYTVLRYYPAPVSRCEFLGKDLSFEMACGIGIDTAATAWREGRLQNTLQWRNLPATALQLAMVRSLGHSAPGPNATNALTRFKAFILSKLPSRTSATRGKAKRKKSRR